MVLQDEEAQRCFLCQEDFSSNKQLQEHQRLLHTAPRYTCDICGRGFSRSSRLTDHIRSHTGERPFQCDVCMKRFTVQRALRKHQEIHSREERAAAAATSPQSLQTAEQQVRTDRCSERQVFQVFKPFSGSNLKPLPWSLSRRRAPCLHPCWRTT